MSIILKILLAVASIIFCVASVYATCKVWKRRLSYRGPRNINCQDEPRNRRLRKVQDEMFESISKN